MNYVEGICLCPYCEEDLQDMLDQIALEEGISTGDSVECVNCEQELLIRRVDSYYEVEPYEG